MKFSIQMNMAEVRSCKIFENGACGDDFLISVNGREFKCYVETVSQVSDLVGKFSAVLSGQGNDTKAKEIAQAKAEVNRTKEAHKEAQRKLSALMEEENVK